MDYSYKWPSYILYESQRSRIQLFFKSLFHVPELNFCSCYIFQSIVLYHSFHVLQKTLKNLIRVGKILSLKWYLKIALCPGLFHVWGGVLLCNWILNISTECVSDVQALGTEADDLLGLLPFHTALQKGGGYPPQMQKCRNCWWYKFATVFEHWPPKFQIPKSLRSGIARAKSGVGRLYTPTTPHFFQQDYVALKAKQNRNKALLEEWNESDLNSWYLRSDHTGRGANTSSNMDFGVGLRIIALLAHIQVEETVDFPTIPLKTHNFTPAWIIGEGKFCLGFRVHLPSCVDFSGHIFLEKSPIIRSLKLLQPYCNTSSTSTHVCCIIN